MEGETNDNRSVRSGKSQKSITSNNSRIADLYLNRDELMNQEQCIYTLIKIR
jgi:hypothetical protein